MLVENIRRLCNENGITFWSLERTLGLGNGVIGKWAKYKTGPRLDTVQKVAKYFGVTVDELLSSGEKEGTS